MRRYLSLPALALPAILGAQRASPPVVAVRVVDSASAPVPGADVSLVRGVSTTVARRRTDAAGRATFAYAPDDSANQIVIRKVGFLRAYQFFAVGSLDTVHVLVRLTRTAVTLAPVKVTAEEDLRRKSYYLTAEDIENSSRTMIDGTDLFKLRPDMMSSRGGPKACEVPWTPRTGWIESVWVNGERVNLTDIDSQYVAGRKPALGIAAPIVRPNPTISQYHAPKPRPLPYTTFSHMDSVLSILRGIHSEHIAEVTYHDCRSS